jgi:hypothetical protein
MLVSKDIEWWVELKSRTRPFVAYKIFLSQIKENIGVG